MLFDFVGKSTAVVIGRRAHGGGGTGGYGRGLSRRSDIDLLFLLPTSRRVGGAGAEGILLPVGIGLKVGMRRAR